MAITLHKFSIFPDEDENHVFTFLFDNPKRLQETRSVESSEVSYGGHRWSLVCMRKEERHLGLFLKWRYSDGSSASSVSCRAKYSLTLVHRNHFSHNKVFHSTQKFTNAQNLLGKSKLIPLQDLYDQGAGYLDDTGKRVVLELRMSQVSTRFEKTVDTSPRNRTRKNASGFYYDTNTFVVANHRWFLRVYPQKANSNGLPAIYLYLASKVKGIAMETVFTLNLGQDCTEILSYHFGEGAKFDGFGKSLPEPLYKVDKITELTVGVELSNIITYRCATVKLKAQGGSVYTPHVYNDYRSGLNSRQSNFTTGSLAAAEAFPDQEGNHWKMEIVRESKKLCLLFDKGVHHYPQNKTKLLCWSASLLSRDPHRAPDVDMQGEPLVGYFSNFIDDKGYLMVLPIDVAEVEQAAGPYLSQDGEITLRLNFISLQTIPIGMRSLPRFDFHHKHLLRARQELQESVRSLDEMREMSASRASLSMLDTSITSHGDRLPSDSMTNGRETPNPRMQLFKSYDSLDELSSSELMMAAHDDVAKSFCGDLLRNLAELGMTNKNSPTDYMLTGRDTSPGAREDLSTESGVTMSEESNLFSEARPSPVDMSKQKETVNLLVKFLQRLPLRITEVLEAGSVGMGTATRSRMDVDLVLFSPDFPRTGQESWVQPLLEACRNFLDQANSSPEPLFPLPKCSDFVVTPFALQFTCGGMDVDVMLSRDWDTEENGYEMIYDLTCKQTTKSQRQWCSLGTARLQKKFVTRQPTEVKELIKVVKHWRQCVPWKRISHRPNSYLLSLLVIKAVDETRSIEMRPVLEKLGQYIVAPELRLSWSTYYHPEKYPVEFDPPTPLLRDPANPGVNIAESLPYWGQFRSEFLSWMSTLGIALPQPM